MWTKLCQALAHFPTVVLSWVDPDGYPISVRISSLEPIDGAQVLRFTPPAGLEPRVGPASILGHSHNEETWHLKAFLARGLLEHHDDKEEEERAGWAFRPLTFIPGAGVGSPLDQVKPALRLRPTAKRYLKRRHLPRPAVPWDNIKRSY